LIACVWSIRTSSDTFGGFHREMMVGLTGKNRRFMWRDLHVRFSSVSLREVFISILTLSTSLC
jgi:hypothetical protein